MRECTRPARSRTSTEPSDGASVGRMATDLAESAFGVGMPERVELKTIDSDEVTGIDRV